MKIDINKKYRTRDGREVTHLHRAPEGWPGAFPWRGMAGEEIVSWTDDGGEFSSCTKSRFDLIEVREPLEIRCIVNNKGAASISQDVTATWDLCCPHNAPHRIAKFREVIEETNPTP